MFCAITSGDIKPPDKRKIIEIWLATGLVDFTLRKQTGEDILDLCKRNSLEKYVLPLLERED